MAVELPVTNIIINAIKEYSILGICNGFQIYSTWIITW